jgi:hypothetical protein
LVARVFKLIICLASFQVDEDFVNVLLAEDIDAEEVIGLAQDVVLWKISRKSFEALAVA